jgi:hypothetical protein
LYVFPWLYGLAWPICGAVLRTRVKWEWIFRFLHKNQYISDIIINVFLNGS